MTNKRKVTRQSSCGQLGLPTDLACQYCVNSITKASMKGIRAKRIKKCIQPWLPKWSNHREVEKVRVHKKVIDHLGEVDISNNEIIETCVYIKSPTSNTKGISDDVNDNAEVILNHSTNTTSNSNIATDNPSTTQEPTEADVPSDSISSHDIEGGVSAKKPFKQRERNRRHSYHRHSS